MKGNLIKITIVILVVSIIVLVLFMGCGKAPAETTAAETTAAETTAAETTAAEEGKVKVGWSAANAGWPWFASFAEEFEKVVVEKGFEGITLSADADVSKQIAQIKDFITMKVDYLIISPLDPEALHPVIKEAYEAGIKIINITNLLPEETLQYVTAVRVPDDVGLARGSMELIVEALNGEGEIVVVDGMPAHPGNITLWVGFDEVLNSPAGQGITILDKAPANFDPIQAIEVTEDLLTRFPDADGILSIDGAMTSGVIQVVKEVGYEGIVVGCSGTLAEKNGIADGILYGTTCKSPKRDCDIALDVIEKLVAGEEVTKIENTPTVKVTMSNVDECPGDW